MMNREGPLAMISRYSCYDCRYLNSSILADGQTSLVRTHCQHPGLELSPKLIDTTPVGSAFKTPGWCPYISGKKIIVDAP